MDWLSVPAGRDEVTTQWLSRIFGPLQSFTIEQIGEEFGLSGSTFKVDLCPIDAPRRQVAIKFASYDPTAREIMFFERCAADTPLRLPDFVAGAVDHEADRGVVVLEYLADLRQGDVLAGCTRAEAITLARMLARLHAAWWGADDAATSALAELGDDTMASGPGIREDRLGPFLNRHGGSLPWSMRELLEDLPNRLALAYQKLRMGPITLIHRDWHLDNVLFAPSGEPFVIDWQGAAVGPPATDLARFMVECLTAEQHRSYGSEALLTYVEELARRGIHRPMSDASQEIGHASLRLLARIINWLGRTPPDPPGSRKEALGRNILHNIAMTLEAFSMG
ncbi:MAG TPA: aminoglycoside phosphotransferase family protein [Acidimicrobiia bacterium]